MVDHNLKIKLCKEDVGLGAGMGIARHVKQMFAHGGNTGHGRKRGFGWEEDIEGAIAEVAFCRAFGLRYAGGFHIGSTPDVSLCQVRSTHHEEGHLLVRSTEKPNTLFVLVIGFAPAYRVVGWLPYAEARQPQYYTAMSESSGIAEERRKPVFGGEPTPRVFKIPQEDLRPLPELHALLRRECPDDFDPRFREG